MSFKGQTHFSEKKKLSLANSHPKSWDFVSFHIYFVLTKSNSKLSFALWLYLFNQLQIYTGCTYFLQKKNTDLSEFALS